MENNSSKRLNGAFATLLTCESYALGVKVLAWTLREVGSDYPLVVLYTPGDLSTEVLNDLSQANLCILRKTSRIQLAQETDFILANYSEAFTKLQVFGLVEFDRVVLLDADMILRQNIDELMEMKLPKGWIAASHGCRCNPMKKTNFPKDWVASNCAYAVFENLSPNQRATAGGSPPADFENGLDYFNAGLVVLRPSLEDLDTMKSTLANLPTLTKYRFAEQDFLNEIYKGRWIALSYKYNALKTLRTAHPLIWDDDEVKVVHYIFTKPWSDLSWDNLPESEKELDAFYKVNSWWFAAHNRMLTKEKHPSLRNL